MNARLELLWAWLHRTFPERQIYVRSGGRVQFVKLGPSIQLTIAGLAVIGFGWTAFSTVNVVFKDRILAASEHRFQQMQAAYENRVAELQLSYDELNAAAAKAQSRADAALAAFRSRQARFARAAGAPAEPPSGRISAPNVIASGAMQPARETSRLPLLQSILGWMSHPQPRKSFHLPPSLAGLETDASAVAQLGSEANLLMANARAGILRQTEGERKLIAQTGIEPGRFLQKLAGAEGMGGPEVPLDQVRLKGVPDPEFVRALLEAEANLAQFLGLSEAIGHLPLSLPVTGASAHITSGFGPRKDPFTGHAAFHPGVDFAGPEGSTVVATNAGRVVSAGYDGSYGNMVEIDHGLGLRTRYAHLMAVAVRPGQVVAKGTLIGRIGSTGRSTGPHVHYEVWYDNTVRNPDGFIRAGRASPPDMRPDQVRDDRR